MDQNNTIASLGSSTVGVAALVYARHLVRVGQLGHVGRFGSAEGVLYPRRARVVCRTARGLEVGEVLATADPEQGQPLDGNVLRRLSSQDELLWERIQRRQRAAFQACDALLKERGVPAVLMDVEHLFDGQSLYFYFLGDVSPEVEALTGELAEAYEAKVQFRKFTETVVQGCGPGCGTAEATGEGCGSGGCSSCSVAAACSTRSRG